MGAMPVPNGGNAASIAPHMERPSPPSRLIVGMYARLGLTLALLGSGCTQPAQFTDPSDRVVAIYSAVIEHMVTEEGQASGFPVVYVLDHTAERASEPQGVAGEIRDIPAEIRAGIEKALADVAAVEFIADRESVIGPFEEGGRVQNGGILLTLGPIRGEGERVEVPASSYIGNLAGSWQTWVVELRAEGWQVTGTSGPVAVS